MPEDYSWVTTEMFDRKLREIVGRMTTDELLAVPGIYDELREDLNNQILDELKEEREEKE